MIDIISDNYEINLEYFKKVVVFVSSQIKLSGNATIKIGDEKESRDLNNRYRNKDYPTDVLTFPLNEQFPDSFYLGDIFICFDVLKEQAKKANISENDELTTLIVHGLLHLKGNDHETDSGEMLKLQDDLLKEIKESVE